MLEIFFHASALIKLVLVLLAGLSVVSWGIILYKIFQISIFSGQVGALKAVLQAAPKDDAAAFFKGANTLQKNPLAQLIAANPGKRHSRREFDRLASHWQAQEIARLQSYLIFLATTASAAPFIGLLGTVWGIMDAFKGIGTTGSASLAVVAPAIAEALVTTAAGLAAAIPAVMAYNFFLNAIRTVGSTIELIAETASSFMGEDLG